MRDNANYDGKVLSRVEGIIIYRRSRITPTKQGEFCAVWKRAKDGSTQPYTKEDLFDFFVIENENNTGYFKFPKRILEEYKIITVGKSVGKRGFRLYNPKLVLTSNQAQKTQSWQQHYYFDGAYDLGCE